ncbi:MAG: S-methyl-5-thioribose-1-phosphate isomerase [candidate division WOR-3 bacterium]
MKWANTIKWCKDHVELIDQRKIPLKEEYLKIRTAEEMYKAIKEMIIRGAPAIGVAAAYGIALAALKTKNKETLQKKIALIESARPTAYNLFYAVKRMKDLLEKSERIEASSFVKEAIAIHEEDKKLTELLGENGAPLIEDKALYMTICNAGALATGGIGTALAVFYKAKEQGKKFTVFVPETRPYLQGARLTAWELQKNGIEVILIVDGAIGHILKTENIKGVFVGADRIAKNGDVANKIGTYSLAISAKENNVPFYVVAPKTTFDIDLVTGERIPIEERPEKEVTEIMGLRVAPHNIKVRNPAFDVTPGKLISGIVTDKGIIPPPFKKNIKRILC